MKSEIWRSSLNRPWLTTITLSLSIFSAIAAAQVQLFSPQRVINVPDPDGIEGNGDEGDADGAVWVIAADLDGDYALDILSASFRDDKIAWHANLDEPPTAPGGGLSIAILVDEPSTVRPGQTIAYDFLFTSDDGERIHHTGRTALFDLVDDPDLIRPGQIWTVTVTPVSSGLAGPPLTATVEILDPKLGVARWKFYDVD